ncbi:MAG: methyltransferase domain-containing protein [Sulfuritalea sp.]|nr:methyltransferase domain-containing protein [Sulfuritalea sp.]
MGSMNLEMIERAYRRHAPGYDRYFGKVLQPGRNAVIEQMRCRSGDHILEVGVGTGLSLPLYQPGVRVCGVDLCHEMLVRAQQRVTSEKLDHVSKLCRMNAERMAFADDSFDKVVAMYVVSVVSNPARLIDEMRRVCKPDGELFIVNHFESTHPFLAGAERLAAPLSRFMGFHPNLNLARLVDQARLEVVERRGVNAFGYWTFLRVRNNKRQLAAA